MVFAVVLPSGLFFCGPSRDMPVAGTFVLAAARWYSSLRSARAAARRLRGSVVAVPDSFDAALDCMDGAFGPFRPRP
jgi:hypothetical protein